MSIPGSFHSGFAPRDGQPLYPELWRGCVGAWAPCLGPTGLTLRDWSGFARHGTLTNLTAFAGWTAFRGAYVMSFPTTANEFVETLNPGLAGATQFSLAYWLVRTGTNNSANGNGVVGLWSSQGTGSANQFVSLFVADAIRFTVGTTSLVGITASQTINLHTPYHIACVYNGSTVAIYVDGVLGGSASQSGALAAGTGALRFGSYAANEQSVCSIDDIRLHNRALTVAEIRLLASRRGIAYDLAPRKRTRTFAGGFKAYWAARKAQILGGGL